MGTTYRGRPGHAWGCDDAYISYRYARHLAAGEGLVFNPAERVEGYSNFLYVLILSGLVKLSDTHIYYLSSLLNMLLLIGCLWLFIGRIKTVYGESSASTAGFLFALCPYLWLWAASGMETILVLLVQVGIWIVTDRLAVGFNRRLFFRLAILTVLSILARADGFVFPALAVGVLLLKRQYKSGLLTLSVLAAGVGLYFAWRYSYYGYWLPNTYYVKVSGPLQERLLAALSLFKTVLFGKGFVVYFAVMAAVLIHGLIRPARTRTGFFKSIESNILFMTGWLG
jgi:arabinofuranosyltransferase